MALLSWSSLKRGAAAVAALALAAGLAACSETGGRPRGGEGPGGTAGGVDTPRLTVAMVTHGAPGDTFWDLVRRGAEDAAKKNNIELRYSADPQSPNQSNLVDNAVDSRVDGIAITMPNAAALAPAARRADEAGIPVVGLNSGMEEWQDAGMSAFFGQDESVAGRAAGEELAERGAGRVLCVIHEQGNDAQEERCRGVAEGAAGAEVETLYVNGMELAAAQATMEAKLQEDDAIDAIMALTAPVAMRAVAAASGSEVAVATFDTDAELAGAIEAGDVAFAVDQQPYLQGYLAVDAIWLAHRNGSAPGGGRPVYTGPSIVDETNVDDILEAAREGLR
ncbi:substrate-binding domain-containing protein [Corynebacterium otitidis]